MNSPLGVVPKFTRRVVPVAAPASTLPHHKEPNSFHKASMFLLEVEAEGVRCPSSASSASTEELVASSNNNEYRLKPVFGFIDAGATAQVEITRLAGPPKDEKLVIQFAPAPEGAADPQEAFKGLTPAGDVTVPIKTE